MDRWVCMKQNYPKYWQSGQDPKTWKVGTSFHMSLALRIHTNFQQSPIKWGFGRNFRTKISTFIVVKNGNLCLKIPPEASFYWKLVRIVIRSVKDIRKYGHIFQVLGSQPHRLYLGLFSIIQRQVVKPSFCECHLLKIWLQCIEFYFYCSKSVKLIWYKF